MFKDRLKELREDRGLTQDEMADILKVSRSQMSNYETGKYEPSIDTLIFLADFFNVSLDYLLGRTKRIYNISLKSNKDKLKKEMNELIDKYC